MPFYIVRERTGLNPARVEVTEKTWLRIGQIIAEDMKNGRAHVAEKQPGVVKPGGRR